MANPHGDFIWYELLTPNADASAEFYAAVIGWQARQAQGGAGSGAGAAVGRVLLARGGRAGRTRCRHRVPFGGRCPEPMRAPARVTRFCTS